jgi:hypothetical protein
MTNDKPYIKIVEDDEYEPSAEELMLDNSLDLEYTTPYTDNDDFGDLYGSGEQFEVGGIFDDR